MGGTDRNLGMPIVQDCHIPKDVKDAVARRKLHMDLENRFMHHPPVPRQTELYEANRSAILMVAKAMSDRCPDSRELSIALTKLDEALFFANAAIARYYGE